jgi:hypothetical protein
MILPRIGLFLVFFSVLPAFVPGAMSIIGYFICLAGLILSVTNCYKAPTLYKISSSCALISTLLINDTLRIIFNSASINPIEQWVFIALIIIMIINGAFKLKSAQKSRLD